MNEEGRWKESETAISNYNGKKSEVWQFDDERLIMKKKLTKKKQKLAKSDKEGKKGCRQRVNIGKNLRFSGSRKK
jgi:hypothetical protein